MEKGRGDSHNIYQREEPDPPGLNLTTHVEPVQVNDETPLELELEAAVCCLSLLKAGRYTHLCAEHFKKWLREAYPRENSKTPPWTERWMCLVDIVQ